MNKKNLWSRMQWALWTDSGETYVDTGVKMLLAIVIGALLLTGIYGIFSDIILTNVSGTIQGFFDQTPTLDGAGGGSGGNGGSGGGNDSSGGFPITWNTWDAYENNLIVETDDGEIWVKISDYTPSLNELEMTNCTEVYNIYNEHVYSFIEAIQIDTNLLFAVYSDSSENIPMLIVYEDGEYDGYYFTAGSYTIDCPTKLDFTIDHCDVFTFFINNVEYQALDGMTWGVWCKSSFNTNSEFTYDEDNVNSSVWSSQTGAFIDTTRLTEIEPGRNYEAYTNRIE